MTRIHFARLCMLIMAMLLAGTANTMAQSNIEKELKIIEKRSSKTEKVVKRNPKTKEVGLIVTSYQLYSKEGIRANALREAFEKDIAKASDVQMSHNDSKGMTNCKYVLTFEKGKTKTVYSLEISGRTDRPLVKVKMYFRDTRVNISDVTALNKGKNSNDDILVARRDKNHTVRITPELISIESLLDDPTVHFELKGYQALSQ